MNPDCQAFREKLSAYMEGDLNAAERDAVTGHLGQCSSCSQELGTLRQMLQEMKQLPPVQVPADFRRKFWAKVDGPAPGVSPVRRILEPWYLKIPVGALATAAVVLLAVRTTTQVAPKARLAPAQNLQAFRQKSAEMADLSEARRMSAFPPPVGRTASGASAQMAKVSRPPATLPPPAQPAPAVVDQMSAMDAAQPPPVPSLHLRVVLYVQDPAVAHDQLLRLAAQSSAQFLQPPVPFPYEFLVPQEKVEAVLERLKQIGLSMELRQESAAPAKESSSAQITVDVLSAGSR